MCSRNLPGELSRDHHGHVVGEPVDGDPFVRRMQVGGLLSNDSRPELVRVVNEMRKNKESLTDEESGRILSFAYPLSDPAELRQALSAVPAVDSEK